MDICGYTCGNLTDAVMNTVLQNNTLALLQLFRVHPHQYVFPISLSLQV